MAMSVLNNVDNYKYLGVLLNSKLSSGPHVAAASKKAMNMLYFIHRNLKKSTPLVRERAYTVFVQPILEYAAAAWDPYTNCGISQLEKVQRKAVRIVTQKFDWSRFCTDDLLQERNWLSLANRREIIRLTTLFKCRSGYPGLQDLHVHIQQPHYLSTRVDHTYKIREISAKTDQFKYSFLPRTIRDWNRLPQSLFDSFENFTAKSFRKQLISNFSNNP
jgi:hypothetical protein